MINIEVTQHINAPREKVWEILSDHEGYIAFKGVSLAKLLKPGDKERNGLGAVREVKLLGVTFIEDIVTFEPPQLLEYHVKECSMPIKHEIGRVELKSKNNGTEIYWISRAEPLLPVIGGLLGKAFTPVYRYIFKQVLLNIKNRLEV